jgi:hypothetical protein
MGSKTYRGLLWVCLLLSLSCSSAKEDQVKQDIECLYSDGAQHYEALCRLLVQYLEESSLTDYDFSSISRPLQDGEPLSGAMDILDAIATPPDRKNGKNEKIPEEPEEQKEKFYIGFTQGDVAYYFQSGGHPLYPTPHRHREQVISLGQLYPEYLHLYSQGVEGAADLRASFPEWRELYLGAPGSGTLITSLNVLSLLIGDPLALHGEDLEEVRDFFYNPGNLALAEAPGEPPAGALLVSGPGNRHIQNRLDAGRGRLISLRKAEARHVRNAFSRFYNVETVKGYGDPCLMVAVPALLVASKGLPSEVAESIIQFIERVDADDGEAFLQDFLDRVEPRPEFLTPEFVTDLHGALEKYQGKRKENPVLSPHRAYLNLRNDHGLWEVLIAGISLFLAIVLTRWAMRTLPARGSLLAMSPRLSAPIAFFFCLAWLHFCLFVVWRLELHHYMRYRTDQLSSFITNEYPELFPMVLHYIASAFSAERLFPISRGAQLLWLSIPLLIGVSTLVGLVHVALPPVLGYLRQHLNEDKVMELKDHFIICNWNEHADEILRQIRIQEQMAGRGDPTILILARHEEAITLPKLGVQQATNLPEHVLYALPPGEGAAETGGILKVIGILGNPQDQVALRMIRPAEANTIIVFPDAEQPNPDSATVLTILKLQDILGEDHDARILVWCQDARNVPLFLDPRFRLSDVCSTEWAWRVICQATRVGHVSNIYRHLLTSSADSNEFYEYCLPEDWTGGTFQALQQAILQFNAQNCEEVPGWEGHRNTILPVGYFDKEDRLRKEPQINPPPESELEAGDCLLFLTYVFNGSTKEKLDQYLLGMASS